MLSKFFRQFAHRTTIRALLLLLSLVWASSPLADEDNWLEDAVAQVLSRYDETSILLVGELHGSRETPALVSALVHNLSTETPVTVALEIPYQEQSRIDRFLMSDGSRKAVGDLLKGDFWQIAQDKSDGRRSEAMLALIESLRSKPADNYPTAVVLLDEGESPGKGNDRQERMADRIAALSENLKAGPVIVLIGNYHARLAPNSGLMMSDGKPIEPPRPTASRVKNTPLTSMNVSACQGEIWACFGEPCGLYQLANQCPQRQHALLTELDPDEHGYHMSLMLPRHNASPPARGR